MGDVASHKGCKIRSNEEQWRAGISECNLYPGFSE